MDKPCLLDCEAAKELERENEKLREFLEYVDSSIAFLSSANASIGRKEVQDKLNQMQAVLDLTKKELEAGE